MAKKRANGEGNIRKRKDGRWEGRYTAGYNPETGKRIIKNVLGKTQAECKAKLAAAMEASKGVDVSRADEYTVATWLRSWYDIYAKPNVRVATADRYRLMIEQRWNNQPRRIYKDLQDINQGKNGRKSRRQRCGNYQVTHLVDVLRSRIELARAKFLEKVRRKRQDPHHRRRPDRNVHPDRDT